MMFAARKLQGIGLIMLLTIIALIAYPISLRVAATRAQLAQVEREIQLTRDQNRMLEGDIAVLANARQLDRWNREFLGYVAPGADQYLPGERALASLERLRPAPAVAAVQPILVSMQAPPAHQDEEGRAGESVTSPRSPATEMAMVDRRAMTASIIRDISRSQAIGPDPAGSGQ